MLIASACGTDEEKKRPAGEPAPPSKAAFEAPEVRGMSPSDKPEAGPRAAEEAPKAIALLNAFYDAAFIVPAKWERGVHPGLAALFTAEAQPHIPANLEALALADLAARVKDVKPVKQAARMSFFIEDDLSSPTGVVSVAFEAQANARKKSEGPLLITHNASYWLTKEGDSYKIWAYTAELKADTRVKSAAFGDFSPGSPG